MALDQIEHHEAKLGPHVAAAATTVPGSGSDPGTLTGLPQGTLTFEATVDTYVLQYVGTAPTKAVLQAVGVPCKANVPETFNTDENDANISFIAVGAGAGTVRVNNRSKSYGAA